MILGGRLLWLWWFSASEGLEKVECLSGNVVKDLTLLGDEASFSPILLMAINPNNTKRW